MLKGLIRRNIKLLTTKPVRSKGYFIPYKTREVMETEIQEMLVLGVIEPSIYPYSSSVLLRDNIIGPKRIKYRLPELLFDLQLKIRSNRS